MVNNKNINSRKKNQEREYQGVLEYCKINGYTLLSPKEDIINNRSILKFSCPKHGVQEKTVSDMLQGKKCRKCSDDIRGEKSKEWWAKSQEEREQKYYDSVFNKCLENKYTLITSKEDLKNYGTYIEYYCPKHGIQKMKLGNFLNGKKCPKCRKEEVANKYKLSIDEVIKRIESCGGILLNPEDYKNQSEKNLKIICPVCGEVFITSLRHFIQHGGQACPKCNRKISVGERRIRDYLDNHSISYEAEKWFSDCRDDHPLPFDFYLPDDNCIIEFDGEQHFKENHYFNGVTTTYIKRHDEIKTKYCEDNDIRLIRIPYTQMNNLEKILDEELIA